MGEALGQPPLAAAAPLDAGGGVQARARRILAERCREALFRWLQGLPMEPPWMGRTDLGLAAYLDHVPVLVEAVAAALQYGDAEEFFRRNPRALERARRHARARRGRGIPLPAVARELTLLRDEIQGLFQRHPSAEIPTEEVLDLVEAVNLTLDRVVEETTRAYVEGESRAA